MKKTLATLALALLALSAPAQITTRIEGTVFGAEQNDTLYFGEWQQDYRIEPARKIPVKDGRLSFEWTAKDTTAYELCFMDEYNNGEWSSYYFFSEGGTLNIEITKATPRIFTKNPSITKTHSDLYQKVFDIFDEEKKLKEKGHWYSEEAKVLMNKMNDENLSENDRSDAFKKMSEMLADGTAYTSEGKKVNDNKRAQNRMLSMKCDSIIGGTPNVIGLRLLAERISRSASRKVIKDEHVEALQPYLSAMPNHPLVLFAQRNITSVKMQNESLPIPDLSARDLGGKEVKLRSLIKSKYTILNLWASWCGPCRKHSKELIPVYEKYSDRGLSILAVAREHKNTEAMKTAMEKDGYPWTSYVDLGDEFQVWQQMGVGNGGGAIFLLDADGRVLKTNPTPEEIAAFLNENL